MTRIYISYGTTNADLLLCIVHIPKTAGTAMRETLRSSLGRDNVYWIGDSRPVAHWENAIGTEFQSYSVVGGHYEAMAFEKIGRPKVFMAVVRDPVERAISLFDYITNGPDFEHPLRAELLGLSVKEAIKKSPRFRDEITNRQCALIGGSPTFSAARQSICEREWLIGSYEVVDEVLAHVWTKFGWSSMPLVAANVNERPGYIDEYNSDETLDTLRELNRHDILLYNLFRTEASKCLARE